MVSPLRWRELLRKRMMKKTKMLEWEDSRNFSSHIYRIRTMKPAVDNGPPASGPREMLLEIKNRNERAKMRELNAANNKFLHRLWAVKYRKPGSMWAKSKGLMRGDGYKFSSSSLGKSPVSLMRNCSYFFVLDQLYSLKEATARPNKIKGPLPPPIVSFKKLKDHVIEKLVVMEDMTADEEAWLRKWLSSHQDVRVEPMEGPVSAQPPPPPPPPKKDPPPATKGPKKKEEEPEPEPENIDPRTPPTKRNWDIPLNYFPEKWEWDATPRSVLRNPTMTSPRWNLPPVLYSRKWSAESSLQSSSPWPRTPKTPPSHRQQCRGPSR